jgi:hypothetical protein
MLKFFAPAISIMSRLRFSLKLGLIGVLFMIPIAGLAYFSYCNISEDIDFAKIENLAVRQILPARQLLESTQVHRRTHLLALTGDASAKEKLPGIAASVDAQIEEIRKIDATSSVPVKIEPDLAVIQNVWTEIKNNLAAYTAEESLKKHGALVEGVVKLFPSISDNYNITYDPERGDYYLVNLISLRIPSLFQGLGQFRLNGFKLNRKAASPDEMASLNVLYGRYAKEYETFLERWSKAAKANPGLASALAPKVGAVHKTAEYFRSPEVAALLNGELSLNAKEFYDHASAMMVAM